MVERHRRHLVVVRAGDASRHEAWLAPPSRRDWALGVSYYGSQADRFRADADYYTRFVGGKWDGLFHFFAEHPHCLDGVAYIWLPDDDLETSAGEIERMFAMAEQFRLELCQPSLRLDSVYSHRLVLSNRHFRLRYTNFVELMAPLMCREVFDKALPAFHGRPSGLGLDWIWPRLARDPARGIAVVDEIAVGHYRPLGRHLRGNLSASGHDADAERQKTLTSLQGTRIYPLVHAAVLRSGRSLGFRPLVAATMVAGFYLDRRRITHRPWPWTRFASLLYRQVLARAPAIDDAEAQKEASTKRSSSPPV